MGQAEELRARLPNVCLDYEAKAVAEEAIAALAAAEARVAELEAENKRLRQAWTQRVPDGEPCALCGDTDHQAFECRFNPVKPSPKWRCFHCNQVFNDAAAAQEHFGDDQHGKPMCILTRGTRVAALETENDDLRAQVAGLEGRLHDAEAATEWLSGRARREGAGGE